MANFTATEAKASKIIDFTKNFNRTTGAFVNYSFRVQDARGNEYEWEDTHATLNYSTVTGVGLTDAQIGVYVYKYLTAGAKADATASYAGVTKVTSTPKLKKASSTAWKGNVVRNSENFGFINRTIALSEASVPIVLLESGEPHEDESSEDLIDFFTEQV